MIKPGRQLTSFGFFLKAMLQQRYVVRKLVLRDFQKKYLGSVLGLPWAFLQPAAIVMVLWFVFAVGLRIGMVEEDIPFLPWFMCGIIPWFFISESLTTSSQSLLSHSFLIKQVQFRSGIIPLVPLVTALMIHLFLVLVLMMVLMLYGYYPSIYWIQLPYYLTGAVLLLTGLGWLLSALMVFFRDLKQLITIGITMFFWLTPIIWPHTRLAGHYRLLANLNPFYYLTNGYRETFMLETWFYENIPLTLYFWILTALMFFTGALVFHRLKPHFADVL